MHERFGRSQSARLQRSHEMEQGTDRKMHGHLSLSQPIHGKQDDRRRILSR